MYNDIKHDILLIPGQSLTLSDTFISFSNEYLTWKAGIDRARYLIFFFRVRRYLAKQPLRGSELFAVGISSDALCGIALYQYFSHKSLLKSATLPDAKHIIPIEYPKIKVGLQEHLLIFAVKAFFILLTSIFNFRRNYK